ncbi:MAG: response regulator [Zetaproteobacteria bacterium]|nr:MAG: response regulator [Zetaproteobacteria bacterium]
MAKATILIVEDNQDISQPIADAFRFAEFDTLQAYDAVQGLQLASERRPDLILMDIQLPDLDGLSAAATLKSDPAVKHIPIVAMTAYDVVGDQAKAISRHCVGHAQKPIRPRDLITLITAVLKLKSDPPPRPPHPSSPRIPRK